MVLIVYRTPYSLILCRIHTAISHVYRTPHSLILYIYSFSFSADLIIITYCVVSVWSLWNIFSIHRLFFLVIFTCSYEIDFYQIIGLFNRNDLVIKKLSHDENESPKIKSYTADYLWIYCTIIVTKHHRYSKSVILIFICLWFYIFSVSLNVSLNDIDFFFQ
jgi:hypothetical protein